MAIIILFILVVAAYTLTAACTDARQRRIPNWLTFPVAAAGILFHMILFFWNWAAPFEFPRDPVSAEFTQSAVITRAILDVGPWAIAGFFVGFALLLLPALLGGGGMGDVKLLAALGAWLGVWWVLYVFVASIMVAAFCTILILTAQGPVAAMRKTRKVIQESKDASSGKKSHRKEPAKPRTRMLPFGVPVAVGTWGFLVMMITGQLF